MPEHQGLLQAKIAYPHGSEFRANFQHNDVGTAVALGKNTRRFGKLHRFRLRSNGQQCLSAAKNRSDALQCDLWADRRWRHFDRQGIGCPFSFLCTFSSHPMLPLSTMDSWRADRATPAQISWFVCVSQLCQRALWSCITLYSKGEFSRNVRPRCRHFNHGSRA